MLPFKKSIITDSWLFFHFFWIYCAYWMNSITEIMHLLLISYLYLVKTISWYFYKLQVFPSILLFSFMWVKCYCYLLLNAVLFIYKYVCKWYTLIRFKVLFCMCYNCFNICFTSFSSVNISILTSSEIVVSLPSFQAEDLASESRVFKSKHFKKAKSCNICNQISNSNGISCRGKPYCLAFILLF